MGQTSGSDRNYIYKDKSERYRHMNTFYIFAVVILWVLFGVYLLAKLASKSIAVGTAVGNAVLIILFTVVELAFYLRNKSDERLKRVVAIGVGVEFALIGMQTDAEFIYFALIAILTLQIPYYDMKRYKQTCIAFTALFTLVEVIRVVKGIGLQDVDSLCRVLCVYLLFFIMYRVGSIAKTFSDHALGSAASEGEKQKVMLEGILDISKTVRDESEKSTGLVDELEHTSETVAQSMQEISSATNTPAKNIEDGSAGFFGRSVLFDIAEGQVFDLRLRNEAVEELDEQGFGDFGTENTFETVVGKRIDELLVAGRTKGRF